MNFTSQEFHDSDEVWLAENVFSQLKDFNSVVMNRDVNKSSNLNEEINSSLRNNDILEPEPIEDKAISILSSETKTENEQFLIQDKDLVFKGIKLEPEFKNQENLPVLYQFNSPKNQKNDPQFEGNRDFSINFAKNNLNYGKSLFYSQEPQKFLEVWMSFPDIWKRDDTIINENNENKDSENLQLLKQSFTTKRNFIKCMKCSQIFKESSFDYHICDNDWIQTLINLNISNTDKFSSSFFYSSNKKLKERLCRQNKEKLPQDPPCFRLLRENIGKIRKFIKDELKIDLADSAVKKNGNQHECTLCERKFVHASGLARHMEKHAMDLIPSNNSNLCAKTNQLKAMIKCLVCGRLFFKTKDATDHLFGDHQENKTLENYKNISEQKVIPDILSEEFINNLIKIEDQKYSKTEDILKKESFFEVLIMNDVLQCEFCEFIFSDCSHLLLHSAYHDPNSGFECISCEIQVQTSKEIFLHWQAECVFARELVRESFTIKRFYTCNVCENKFSSLEQLTDHRYTALHFFPRRNHSIRILQVGCEYCGCIFEKIEHLVIHREEKHLKKLIEKKGINILQENDSGIISQKFRQYLCDICGKSYTQSSHLWQHLRFHRGVKPFACQEPNCNRTFTIRPDLNDHIRKCHTGERPYQCQVCGKRFLTGSVYYQHRLIHRGDRRYACEECGKRFYRADALKNHQRIHTGEKPYNCLYCTKNFRQRGDCDKHIRARHSNLDENAKNVLTALKNRQVPQFTSPTELGIVTNKMFVDNVSFT